MLDIAGPLFFLATIIVVVVFAGMGLVLAWRDRQTRHIAAPEAKATCCEVPNAFKKAA